MTTPDGGPARPESTTKLVPTQRAAEAATSQGRAAQPASPSGQRGARRDTGWLLPRRRRPADVEPSHALLAPPDTALHARRWYALAAAVAAAIAAAFGAANDFGDTLSGRLGLAAFALLNATAAYFSSVAVIVAVARAGEALPMLVRPPRAKLNPPRPPTMSQFTGRAAELAQLIDDHTTYRKLRERDTKVLGPVIIAIHGGPGVGKSALAQELARRLRTEYSDGLVSANFGASGAARGPADITRDLLLRLGWRDDEVPRDTEDRVATLRSLSRDRKILFLFDAARDHDQVNQVMPAGSGCGVIITSRRELGSSLGLAPAQPLGRLSMTDGLELLASISGQDWLRDAPTAVEIVELCERLPLAVLAAAERVAGGADPRHVAELLRDPGTRLSVLDYNTRSVRERIRSEFNRLLPDQHDALLALSTLDSETFVPWMLRSLLGLERGASNMIATLTAAQLVEYVGLDEMGQPRHRLPGLVRAFARASRPRRLDLDLARERLDAAYLSLIDAALPLVDPTYPSVHPGPQPWHTAAAEVARHMDALVRREYLNLVRVVLRAPLPEYGPLVWRVAAYLDGRIPSLRDHHAVVEAALPGPAGPAQPSLPATVTSSATTPADAPAAAATNPRTDVPSHIVHRMILSAFARALHAAQAPGQPATAPLDVLLARAQVLVAVERHRDAQHDLDQVTTRLDALEASATDPDGILRRRLRAARIGATGFIQFSSYAQGNRVMAEAERLIRSLPAPAQNVAYVRTDVELLRLLNAAAERIGNTPQWTSPLPPAARTEAVDFAQLLEEAEDLRRQKFYGAAAQVLRGMLDRDGDTRGRALLYYRLSRLSLDDASTIPQASEDVDPALALSRRRHTRAAVESAAAAVVAFAEIGDTVGQTRARCQLVKALVEADQSIIATQLSIEIDDELQALASDREDLYLRPPLEGRHLRVRAEVQIARASFAMAWTSLTKAARTFRELHDWRNHASVMRRLEHLDGGPDRNDLGDPF